MANRWQSACGDLVRYTEDDDGVVDEADYYARGIGWTSYDVARSSWTAEEQREVTRWRRESEIV